jgi:hypothetical protein
MNVSWPLVRSGRRLLSVVVLEKVDHATSDDIICSRPSEDLT